MFVKILFFMTEKEFKSLVKELNDTKGVKRQLLETKLIKKTLSRMKWEKFWNLFFLCIGAVFTLLINYWSDTTLANEIRQLNRQQVELNERYENSLKHRHPKDTLSPEREKSKSLQ
jgi:hypothetical protein